MIKIKGSRGMKKKSILFILFISATLFLLFNQGSSWGQSTTDANLPAANLQDYSDENSTTLTTLEIIARSLDVLQDQLKNKEEELKSVEVEDLKISIVNEMNELNQRIATLEKNFEVIASGVDLKVFDREPKKAFDWKDELQDLFGPILQELRNATARPREIERLRNEVSFYKDQILNMENGIQNIQDHLEETKDKRLKAYLRELKKRWTAKRQQIANQLAVAQYQLTERQKGQQSFFRSVQSIIRVFFKSRGRNLFLALLSFVLIWLLLHFLYNYSSRIIPVRKSKKRSLYTRLIALAFHIFTFVAATTGLLMVLYIAGDWVLLGLAIIFLFGIAWAARQAIPRFWEQAKLLLNLGPVKENERLVYNGLPWKVQTLNFFTPLVNPELKGGMIRLPLRDLMALHSRPYHPDEPWFPSKEGDWVILADGTYGKVVNQTPEIVEMVLLGGSHKMYQTLAFLQQNPNNLSTNFRLKVTFGIDYKHQAVSTREVPDLLKEFLLAQLTKEGHGDVLMDIRVEFKEAGYSSLDLMVLASFSGRAAKDYECLSRAIQRICVDACNQYGWIIPFTQVTLHTATEKEKANQLSHPPE